MFAAALLPRSCTAPHLGRVHDLTGGSFAASLRCPQAEHNEHAVPSRHGHAMIPSKASRMDLPMQLALGLHEFELEGSHDGMQV